MKKYIIALLLCTTASAFVFSGCRKEETTQTAPSTTQSEDTDKSANAEKSNTLQEFAPPVSFEATAIDGTEITSDILTESKLTMINVWATYCNPCLNEMPALGEIAASYDRADFQILGIISDATVTSDQDTLDLAQSLIDKTDADYTHLLLNEDLYYGMLLEVTAVPTTFFINSDRQIIDTVIGAMEKEDWEAKIEGLLASL